MVILTLLSSLQKAFIFTVPDYQLKLSSILAEAREKHKSLAICSLDLANAYGSVHHSLIQFSLCYILSCSSSVPFGCSSPVQDNFL